MADYLLQLSYTASAWAAMVKRPENRAEAVRKSVEKRGGKINGLPKGGRDRKGYQSSRNERRDDTKVQFWKGMLSQHLNESKVTHRPRFGNYIPEPKFPFSSS